MTENLDPVSSKHSEELARAAERARANSYKLTISPELALATVSCMDSRARNGTVFFYVDENRRILNYYVHPATSLLHGQAHVHIIDEKNLMKVKVISASKLV